MEIQQKYAKLKQYSTRLQEEKTPFSLGKAQHFIISNEWLRRHQGPLWLNILT